MNWDPILVLLFLSSVFAENDLILNRIINIMKRRSIDKERMLESPKNPEDLPESEPIVPGHTLIQPETNMLQSAVKFPQESISNAVYGNMNQLSITYGKTPDRILYTGFRKASSLLDATIYQAIRNIQMYNGNKKDTDVIVIEARSPNYEKPFLVPSQHKIKKELVSYEENNATEVLDESSSSENNRPRRSSHRYKYRSSNRYINDSSASDNSTESETSSESSDYDKNPGNPYTLHKGKYKQNYLWNHFMDGDHMNVNPFAPILDKPGPSGADLFFGRKWWYFNQDDYKPLG